MSQASDSSARCPSEPRTNPWLPVGIAEIIKATILAHSINRDQVTEPAWLFGRNWRCAGRPQYAATIRKLR